MIPNELSAEKVNLIYKKIKPYINYTPVINSTDSINKYFSTNLFFKCEFLQKSGSFKARGAINNIISQDKNKLKNGITAVSAGNHAIASSFVANIFNLRNKIFLYESANKFRIQTCKNYGANIFYTNPKQAFIDADNAKKQGYYFIHPFDGPLTLQGSATLGLEIVNYFNSINEKIDNLIISVGGGGLISGVSSYVKEFYPKVKVIGVEPENANGLSQSFKVNKPLNNINVKSIADSLSAPLHMQYSFDVAKEVIDEMVTITDQQMIESMIFVYNKFRLMLEPACVAGLAAIKYKIKTNLKNKNTVLILCGSNIDKNSWLELIN